MQPIQTLNDLMLAHRKLNELKKISNALQRSFAADCNFGNTSRRDKYQNRLIEKANAISDFLGLHLYIQTDPRGCSVYLLENKSDATQALYNRGHAIY